MRGNRERCPVIPVDRGSIPACAGEPLWNMSRCLVPAVYPRVCGGTHAIQACDSTLVGLSPRVRGNLITIIGSVVTARSIPACAGEPILHYPECLVNTVYPRVCGGTTDKSNGHKISHGLSPRVRGNPYRRRRSGVLTRSIPACAGEPARKVSRRELCRVYPRVCGGTNISYTLAETVLGLSPRVRGNLI